MLRLQAASCELHWRSLLEARFLWIESATTEPSRSSNYMMEPMLSISVGEIMIVVVMLPKRVGDPNGPWRGTDFGSDTACWAHC